MSAVGSARAPPRAGSTAPQGPLAELGQGSVAAVRG